MSEARITKQAASDLSEICLSLYAYNESVGVDRLMASILEKCHAHAESPEAGSSREELFPRLRCFSHTCYDVLYRIAADSIDIIRVVKNER